METTRAVMAAGKEGMNALPAVCEVIDTPDPETKVFRFTDWGRCPAWSNGPFSAPEQEYRPEGKRHFISVFEQPRWGMDVAGGPKLLGRYRVTVELETPPGYLAAYEGTTKPEPINNSTEEPEQVRSFNIEDAILATLEPVKRMPLRDLKRKLHAARLPQFDACLQTLVDEGELTLEPDAEHPKRMWVVTKP